MRKSSKNIGAVSGLALLVSAIIAFLGCDGGKPDLSGLGSAGEGNSSLGTPPSSTPLLRVSPLSVGIARVKEEVVFTVDGGEPPYDWGVANKGAGLLRGMGPNQVRYEVKRLAPNQVIATDSSGQSAIGQVVYGGAGMSLAPATATLTADGQTVVFVVRNAATPVSWSVVYPARGTLVSTSDSSATYQRLSVGPNSIIAEDDTGLTASAAITQDNAAPPKISPATSILSSNVFSVLLTVSGGTPDYTWTVVNGNGSLSSKTGSQTIYTRNPGDKPDNYFISVTDSGKQSDTATVSQQ